MPRVEDVLNQPEINSYVQQREYPLTVGDALFPQVKTEDFKVKYILGANGAPVSASVHAHDTEAQVASREGFEVFEQDMALIKRKIQMKEELMIMLSKASHSAEIQQLINLIYNDVDNMRNAVQTRIEAMRFEAISTGKIVLNENGLEDVTINYRVPDEHKEKLTGTSLWSDPSAKPLEDIQRFVDTVVQSTGEAPTRILTSNKVYGALKLHDTVRTGILGVNSAKLLTNAELNAFLQAQGLPTFATDDRRYRVQLNKNKFVTKRFFPENKLVALPPEALGETLYGVTAEEVNMRNMHNSAFQNFGNIIVQQYATDDPVAQWTKAVAKALPSFPAANKIFIADVLGDGSTPGGGVEG